MNIRTALSTDASIIHGFVAELAKVERALDKVQLSAKDFEGYLEDGDHFNALIAEVDGQAVGMALWYKRFSTWVGDYAHLEDLYVRSEFRGQGIARSLVVELATQTLSLDMKRLEWQVLEWNEPAIKMYEKIGANILSDWRVCQMDVAAMKKLANL